MFFLPTGMWAFVFENIAEFVQRPRQITDKEFEEKRDLLQKNVGKLLQIGKKLQLDKKDFEVKTRNWQWWKCCKKIRPEQAFEAQQNLFEKNCMLAEEEYQKLD